jgi:putative addiction module component (TIGR02574 family)
MITDDVMRLSKSEKILLLNDLWDDISSRPDELSLTKSQEKLLDERYEQFVKNPQEGELWETVRERIKKML